MKHSLVETAKTVLIVVLVLCLVVLFAASIPADAIRNTPWLSAALQPFASLLGLPAAELAYVADTRSVQSAAQPMTISVRNSAGRYTAQWSFAAMDNAYDTLGRMLGQALDTVEPVAAVRQFQLTEALTRPSVCFDYGFSLPAALVASWLDFDLAQEMPDSARYILSLEGEKVWLYLQGDTCFRGVTQVDPVEFSHLLEQFQADGSQFAFEAKSHLEALSVLPGTVPVVRTAQTDSLCTGRYIDALANNLGFNPYDDSRYTDSADVTHFSETGGSLQISAAGEILLTTTTERISAPGSSVENLVEKARELMSFAVDTTSAGARLYLSGLTRSGEETVCSFDYVLDGVPVRWADGPAGQVTFSGQNVTRLQLKAVSFIPTERVQLLLPAAQASAVLPKDGALRLEYHVSAAGEAAVGWAK